MQDDLQKLLKDMLNYMCEIGQEICELAHLKCGHILDQIKEVSIREKYEIYLTLAIFYRVTKNRLGMSLETILSGKALGALRTHLHLDTWTFRCKMSLSGGM